MRTTWSLERSSKMRLSADASGAKAVKNVLETSSKHSANDRRRWWDMGATESVPCFEGDGRTRKRSRRLDEFKIVARPQ